LSQPCSMMTLSRKWQKYHHQTRILGKDDGCLSKKTQHLTPSPLSIISMCPRQHPKAMTHAVLQPKAFEMRGFQTPAHPSIPLALGENMKSSRQK
jgi:hypothetical protein